MEELDIIRRYQSKFLKPAIYISNYFLAVLAILVLLFQKNKLIALNFLALTCTAIIINRGYQSLNSQGIGYEDLLLLKQNLGFGLGEEAMHTYMPTIFKAAIIAFLFAVNITVLRSLVKLLPMTYLWIPLLSLMASYTLISKTNTNRLSIPSLIKIPSLVVYTLNNELYSSDRIPIFFTPENPSEFDHIVWIVDESIRGDLLQLNDPTYETTPFLDSIKDRQLVNFGVINSGAVCSDYSHIMLMSGLQTAQLPDKEYLSRRNPTIFQYAQAAGYGTNLIYSPGYEDAPKGYMTPDDFSFIDRRYHTKMDNPDLLAYQWDHKSIDYLEEVISQQEKSFTYFLKYGAHFHYDHSYPQGQQVFTPIQGYNSYEREDRIPLLNSYKNALRWTVDDFFATLHQRFAGQNILVIYTSDHGQNILDHPEITMTHCVKDRAPQVMAAVPLLAYSPMVDVIPEYGFITEGESASHYNIFPTTLALMGYDKKSIHKKYNYTLLDEDRGKSFYISGDIYERSKMYKNNFDTSKYK